MTPTTFATDTTADSTSPPSPAAIDVMRGACEICGGGRFEPVLGRLARCQTCNYIFYPRAPGLEQRVTELYAGAYFTGGEFGDYARQRPIFARNFQDYLGLMRRAGATTGRLLEVGCAYGFFLEQARGAFEARGIDVNEEAIRQAVALGVRAECAEFLEHDDGQADVVCMWDTIEHVLHPRAYLRKAHEVLTDDGWLFLTTGDIGSLVARLRGKNWRQIHPPSHLNYFSRATMRRLLESIGFEVRSIRSVGTRRDLFNLVHLLGLYSRFGLVRRSARACERRLARTGRAVSVYINLYDTMFVAARKRHTP